MRVKLNIFLLFLAFDAICLEADDFYPTDRSTRSEQHDYQIHFHIGDSSAGSIYTSRSEAEKIADIFDNGNNAGIHKEVMDDDFREPRFSYHPIDGVLIFSDDNDIILSRNNAVMQFFGWGIDPNRANVVFPSRIVLPPYFWNDSGYDHDSAGSKQLCTHELHHAVQWEYLSVMQMASKYYPFVIEGAASAYEDQCLSSVDNEVGYYGSLYNQSGNYFSSSRDDSLWSLGYDSAIFWKYLCEQYGQTRVEPNFGNDFLKSYYIDVDNNDRGISQTFQHLFDTKDRKTTSQNDKGVNLAEIFQDFSIANWIHKYVGCGNTSTSVNSINRSRLVHQDYSIDVNDPQRFYYIDESSDAGATLGYMDCFPEADNADALMPGFSTPPQTILTERYATKYLYCSFGTKPPSTPYGIGFRAQTEEGARAIYALIGVRESGSIDVIHKGAVDPDSGNSFQFAKMQSDVDPYNELVAVFNGLSCASLGSGFSKTNIESTYKFSYFAPEMEILEPNQNFQAFVGDEVDSPGRFIVKLMVTSPSYLGSGSLEGLTADQFEVFVGSTDLADQGEVISAAEMYGEYWLTVKAPKKDPVPGTGQALFVRLGDDLLEIEESAVLYKNKVLDQMLVVDRSGSMGRTSGGVTRIEAACAAAQLYIDASNDDDRVGVVAFDGDNIEPSSPTNNWDDAQKLIGLWPTQTQIARDLIGYLFDSNNPAANFTPSGYTSLGDGLYVGAAELASNGRVEAERIIILLSDGHQNRPTSYGDQLGFLLGANVKIYTIALGPHCNESLLEQIAEETSGRYYKVESDADAPMPLPSSNDVQISSTVTPYSDSMMSRLAEVYLNILEHAHGSERLYENNISIAAGETFSLNYEVTSGGLANALLSVFSSDDIDDISLEIIDPDGVIQPATPAGAAYYDPEYHEVSRIGDMVDGSWTIAVENSGSSSKNVNINLSAQDQQGAEMDIHIVQHHNESSYLGKKIIGIPCEIFAVINDASGPLLDCDIIAEITHPARPTVRLRLKDNGSGLDGSLNDGVYAGIFRGTTVGSEQGSYGEEGPPLPNNGSYKVRIEVVGVDNFERSFSINETENFHIYDDQEIGIDSDNDGMVDNYENLYTGLDKLTLDNNADYDQDGMSNIQEYLYGTNPMDFDTDGGGEGDASETGNPLDDSDDLMIPQIANYRVYSPEDSSCIGPWMIDEQYILKTNQNMIIFGFEEGHSSIDLYKSASALGPFSKIANITTNEPSIYLDQGLTTGLEYYYYLQPLNGSSLGVPTRVFSGTPKSDLIAPAVFMSVNNGNDYTFENKVDLKFNSDSDVIEMKVGLSQDLSGYPWVAYANTISGFDISPVSDGDRVDIYAEFRDSSGFEDQKVTSINFVNSNQYCEVSGVAKAPLDSSHLNIEINFTSSVGDEYRTKTLEDGTWNLVLPRNVHDLTMDLRGYEMISETNLTLNSSYTNLGSYILIDLDTDGDLIADVYEYRDHATSPDDSDTDDDGFSDYVEIFTTMTDPTNNLSKFALRDLSNHDGTNTISWFSSSGIVYNVLSRDDLIDDDWLLRDTVDGASLSNITDWVDNEGYTNRFYMITIP